MIKFDSVSQDELFIKNAMKNKEMHEKGQEIISEAMFKIINSEDPDSHIRDQNTDIFLQRMNQTLISKDPEMAIKRGIAPDPSAKQKIGMTMAE